MADRRKTEEEGKDSIFEQSIHTAKDARDDVQKRTFTKWVNQHLKKYKSKSITPVHDLFKDLRDGNRLIALLEVLTGETIPQERGKLRLHRLQNVESALAVLKKRKVYVVNIGNVDIVDGNVKLTLGLVWTIILHFQISDIKVEGQHLQPKEALLHWAKETIDGVPGVNVNNFGRSWRDGLAFNAIIYRNRPDLVDFGSLRPSEHKKNLRNAFEVAERHLGVPSLLEPEDVDVAEPDERSIMTYVSQLYDVFPAVPPKRSKTSSITTTLKTSVQSVPIASSSSSVTESHIQSARSEQVSSSAPNSVTNGTSPQWEVYAQPARQMIDWIKRTSTKVEDRSVPQTTAEIKRALAELNRLKSEEIPTKQAEKQRIVSKFREIERSTRSTGQYRPPPGLHINDVESQFDRCLLSIQQREHVLNSELLRMEQQDVLADKISRQIPMVSADLDTIQSRIHDAEGKADKLTAADVRTMIDDIESASKTCDRNIAILMREVAQLRQNNHPNGPELSRKLDQLQQRLSTLRNFQIAGTTQKVTSRTTVQGDVIKLERRVEMRTERRFVDGNVDQFVTECYKWVKNKESSLKVASYGDDIEKVQKALHQSKADLHAIREYERNIAKCRNVLSNMTGEELQRNSDQVAILEEAYKYLLNMAVKRVRDIELLLEFVQLATKEMIWMNQKEEEHANRDWSAKNLNIAELEKHYKNLMREIQGRERQITSVQNHGERLHGDNHPAKPCIVDHLSAMQSQWNILTQLAHSLETHLKYAAEYHQDPEKELEEVRSGQSSKVSSELMRNLQALSDPEPNDDQLSLKNPTEKDQVEDAHAHPDLDNPLTNPVNPHTHPGVGDPHENPGNPNPKYGNPPPKPGNPHPGVGDPQEDPGNPNPTYGNPHPKPGNPHPGVGDRHGNPGNPKPEPGNPHPRNPNPDNPNPRNPANPKPGNPKGGEEDDDDEDSVFKDPVTSTKEYSVTTTRKLVSFERSQKEDVPHAFRASNLPPDTIEKYKFVPPEKEALILTYESPPIASREVVMRRVERLLSSEASVSQMSPSEKHFRSYVFPDLPVPPSDSVLTWVSWDY